MLLIVDLQDVLNVHQTSRKLQLIVPDAESAKKKKKHQLGKLRTRDVVHQEADIEILVLMQALRGRTKI